jgi:bacterioferritin (cytochrome b1)
MMGMAPSSSGSGSKTTYREILDLKLDSQKSKQRTYKGTLTTISSMQDEVMTTTFKVKMVTEESNDLDGLA